MELAVSWVLAIGAIALIAISIVIVNHLRQRIAGLDQNWVGFVVAGAYSLVHFEWYWMWDKTWSAFFSQKGFVPLQIGLVIGIYAISLHTSGREMRRRYGLGGPSFAAMFVGFVLSSICTVALGINFYRALTEVPAETASSGTGSLPNVPPPPTTTPTANGNAAAPAPIMGYGEDPRVMAVLMKYTYDDRKHSLPPELKGNVAAEKAYDIFMHDKRIKISEPDRYNGFWLCGAEGSMKYNHFGPDGKPLRGKNANGTENGAIGLCQIKPEFWKKIADEQGWNLDEFEGQILMTSYIVEHNTAYKWQTLNSVFARMMIARNGGQAVVAASADTSPASAPAAASASEVAATKTVGPAEVLSALKTEYAAPSAEEGCQLVERPEFFAPYQVYGIGNVQWIAKKATVWTNGGVVMVKDKEGREWTLPQYTKESPYVVTDKTEYLQFKTISKLPGSGDLVTVHFSTCQ